MAKGAKKESFSFALFAYFTSFAIRTLRRHVSVGSDGFSHWLTKAITTAV
jgi:hypothetical protein